MMDQNPQGAAKVTDAAVKAGWSQEPSRETLGDDEFYNLVLTCDSARIRIAVSWHRDNSLYTPRWKFCLTAYTWHLGVNPNRNKLRLVSGIQQVLNLIENNPNT